MVDTSAAVAILLAEPSSDELIEVAGFLRDADLHVEPISLEDAERAISGWRRYGSAHTVPG